MMRQAAAIFVTWRLAKFVRSSLCTIAIGFELRALSGIDARPYDGNLISDDHPSIVSRKNILPGSPIFVRLVMIASCRPAMPGVGQ
jgi:hypothetical protein